MRKTLSVLVLMVAALAVPTSVGAAGPTRATLPAAAPSTCTLTAQVEAGRAIIVEGTGFALSTDVTVTQVWDGSSAALNSPGTGTTTTQTVTTDAAGAFSITVPAGPGRGGQYHFTAVGGGCTATVDAVAVETAGGLNGGTTGGLTPTPPDALPPTDTAAGTAPPPPANPALPIIVLAIGAALTVLAAGMLRPRRR